MSFLDDGFGPALVFLGLCWAIIIASFVLWAAGHYVFGFEILDG